MAPRKGRTVTAVSLAPGVCEAVEKVSSKTGINGRDVINTALELFFGMVSPDTVRKGHAETLIATVALGDRTPIDSVDPDPNEPATPHQLLEELFLADISGAPRCTTERDKTVQALEAAIVRLNERRP